MTIPKMIADRFEVGELIRYGGMGAVFRGNDRLTGQAIAIKSIKAELLAADPHMVERFAREGEALRTLNHPNIVKLLATAQQDGLQFLIMEYVGGGSLADLLAAQPQLPLERVLSLSLELADALTRAHHLKIIHRDLKPANVLLAEDGTPRLTDFGVAHVRDSKITESGVLVGTLAYLCPEAFGGQGLDVRADLWAFGVMLFEMLAGLLPFESDQMSGLIAAILNQPTPDLEILRPDAPVALVDLVYRLLEKNREQRLPSARLLGAELETIISTLDTSTRPAQSALSEVSGTVPLKSFPSTPAKVLHNLPAQTTPFVGREAELTELAKLLDDPAVRLVTILGPGGMGKTRLALEMAAGQLSIFPHGIYFVALAPLSAPDFIISTIAETIGFTFYQGSEPRQQLLDYLREKSMLLVLDNFEHLIQGAGIVTDILSNAPGMKILATSRERLNLGGEHLFRIEGLDFPDWETPEDAAEYSAVKLFLQSARRVMPSFALATDQLKYLARVCRLVEGLPLGILLAAAWVEALSLPEIAQEIERSFDFLQSEQRDMPERQRSLRAVFDYSWNFLTQNEREVFQNLSAFRGGFTREAAQQVAGASLNSLITLVNKSLVRRNADTGRYEIHELLRQYAAKALAESPDKQTAVNDRHCRYFAAFMQARDPHLKGPKQLAAIREIAEELDNVYLAWDYAIGGRREREIQQIGCYSLSYYFELRSLLNDGIAIFERAVDTLRRNPSESGESLALGQALLLLGIVHSRSANYARAREILQAGLVILRKYNRPRELASALLNLGEATDNDAAGALRLAQESLALFRSSGDQWGEMVALFRLARSARLRGEFAQGDRLLQEGATLADQLGDRNWVALFMTECSVRASQQGQYEEAQQCAEKALAVGRELGRPLLIAYCLSHLAGIAQNRGNYGEAEQDLQQALAIAQELGNRSRMAWALNDLGYLTFLQGKYADAKQLSLKAVAILRELGNVADLCIALNNVGHPSAALGEYAEAEGYFREGLTLARQVGRTVVVLESIEGIANVKGKTGQKERAVELLAFTMNHPISDFDIKHLGGQILDELRPELPPEVLAAAEARGKALDLDTVVAQILA